MGKRWETLDKRVVQTHLAMARASNSSAFFTSRPFSAALSKPFFQLLFLVMSAYYFFAAARAGLGLHNNNTITARMYRFTPTELRDGSTMHPQTSAISSMSIMSAGCPWNDAGGLLSASKGSMVLTFSEPKRMHGWMFTTALDAPPEKDPVMFNLEASDDGQVYFNVLS